MSCQPIQTPMFENKGSTPTPSGTCGIVNEEDTSLFINAQRNPQGRNDTSHPHGCTSSSNKNNNKQSNVDQSRHTHNHSQQRHNNDSHWAHSTDPNVVANGLLGEIENIEQFTGINIKERVAKAYVEFLEQNPGYKSSNRVMRDELDKHIQATMNDLLKDIGGHIDSVIAGASSFNELETEEKEFLGSVSNWMKIGLHSQQENEAGSKHGIHLLETGGANANPQHVVAFQMGHLFNAGRSTPAAQEFRNSPKLDALEGSSLFDLLKKSDLNTDGNFTDLFRSDGSGVVRKNEISSFWGASGNDRDVRNGWGAAQNAGRGADIRSFLSLSDMQDPRR